MKKQLYALGALSAIAAPLAATVSCGSLPDNGTITFESYKQRKAVTATVTTNDTWKSVLALDGANHSITDQSFNQSAYEGMDFSTLTSGTWIQKDSPDNKKPASDKTADFISMYNGITGDKVIVAPGFLHLAPLTDDKGKEATKNQAVIFIDGDIQAGNIASIVFQAHQSGFLAGVQAGYYLNENKTTFGDELKVGTFGGLNIPSVVSYMGGFQKGIEYFNAHKPSALAGPKDIEFIDLGNKSQYFTGGFAPGMAKDISNKLLDAGADLIFPVAGPQTLDVESAIKAKTGSKAKIIGVDVAQEEMDKFPNVVFSALKKVKEATNNMLKLLSGGATIPNFDGGLGKLSIGTLDNGLVGVSQGKASQAAYDFAISDDVKSAAKSMKTEFKF